MEKTTKEVYLRKDEIITTAQELFYRNGFYKTSVSEIAQNVGIAKATIYHHFKSKEEILDAIITSLVKALMDEAAEIANSQEKDAIQKLNEMVLATFKYIFDNYATVNQIHGIDYVNMREKLIVKLVNLYVPVLAEVIQQGNREGLFKAENPLELMEFLIIVSHMSFDRGMFCSSREIADKKAEALQNIIETMLNVERGTFDTLGRMLKEISSANSDESKNIMSI